MLSDFSSGGWHKRYGGRPDDEEHDRFLRPAMVKKPTTWAEGVSGVTVGAVPSRSARSRGRSSRQTGGTSRHSRHANNSSNNNPLMMSGSNIGVDLSTGVSRAEIVRRRNKLALAAALDDMPSASALADIGGGSTSDDDALRMMATSSDSGSAGSLPLAIRELSIPGPPRRHHSHRKDTDDSSGSSRRGRMHRSRSAGTKVSSTPSTTGSQSTAIADNLDRIKQHRSNIRRGDSNNSTQYSDEMEGWMMSAGKATEGMVEGYLYEEYMPLKDHDQRTKGPDGQEEKSRDRGGYHPRRTQDDDRKQHRRSNSDHRHSRRGSAEDDTTRPNHEDAKARRLKEEIELQLRAMEGIRLEQSHLSERMRRIEKEKRRLEKEQAGVQQQQQQQKEKEAAADEKSTRPVRRRKSMSAINAGSMLFEEPNGIDLVRERGQSKPSGEHDELMHNSKSAPELKIWRDTLQDASLRSKQRRRSSLVTASRRDPGDVGGRSGSSSKLSDLDITGAPSLGLGFSREKTSRRRSSMGHTAQVDGGCGSRRSSMEHHSRSRCREDSNRSNDVAKEKVRDTRSSGDAMPQDMSQTHSELDSELLRGLSGMLKRENSGDRNERRTSNQGMLKRENSGDRNERRTSNQGMLKRENSGDRNERRASNQGMLKRENSGDRNERRTSNQGSKKSISGTRTDGMAERRPSVQFKAEQDVFTGRRSVESEAFDRLRRAERRGSMQSQQHAALATSAVGEADRMNSDERERIKTEGTSSGVPNKPKSKAFRRGSLDNAAISKAMGSTSTSKSTVVRRNSGPSEPKQDFVASRRQSMPSISTADSHSQMSRRKNTSHLLKDSGVKLLSADMDLDEPTT